MELFTSNAEIMLITSFTITAVCECCVSVVCECVCIYIYMCVYVVTYMIGSRDISWWGDIGLHLVEWKFSL